MRFASIEPARAAMTVPFRNRTSGRKGIMQIASCALNLEAQTGCLPPSSSFRLFCDFTEPYLAGKIKKGNPGHPPFRTPNK